MDHEERNRTILLFRKLSEGDEKALTAIYDSFSSSIARYLLRLDGMDTYLLDVVKAELLETLWNKREYFTGQDAPISLMMGMVHKIALYRLREREKHTVSIATVIYKESNLHADDLLLSKEYEEELKKAIALLPPQEQRIFNYKYVEQLSNDEIASLLNISRQTVKNTSSRASQKIKEWLGLASVLTIIEIIKSL